MDDYQYIDQWGDKWICIAKINDEVCLSETYFVMEDPENEYLPAAYCTRCKNLFFKNIFQQHIVEGALFGKPIPPEKKVSWAEYLRRDMIETSQALTREREDYAKIKKNWREGEAKELMLEASKEYGEFLAQWVADKKEQLRKVLIHGR